MTSRRVTLVIRADGAVRVARRPRIGPDEVGVHVFINFPDGWGKVVGQFEVDVPKPPEVEA